jgi:hypothetical protein
MFRRQFIRRMTAAGTVSLAAGVAPAKSGKSVVYQIKGFTCVTCAYASREHRQKRVKVVFAFGATGC